MSLRKLVGQWRPWWFVATLIAFFAFDILLLRYGKAHPVFQNVDRIAESDTTSTANKPLDKSLIKLEQALESLKTRLDNPMAPPTDPDLIKSLKDLTAQVEQVGSALRAVKTTPIQAPNQNFKRKRR